MVFISVSNAFKDSLILSSNILRVPHAVEQQEQGHQDSPGKSLPIPLLPGIIKMYPML